MWTDCKSWSLWSRAALWRIFINKNKLIWKTNTKNFKTKTKIWSETIGEECTSVFLSTVCVSAQTEFRSSWGKCVRVVSSSAGRRCCRLFLSDSRRADQSEVRVSSHTAHPHHTDEDRERGFRVHHNGPMQNQTFPQKNKETLRNIWGSRSLSTDCPQVLDSPSQHESRVGEVRHSRLRLSSQPFKLPLL